MKAVLTLALAPVVLLVAIATLFSDPDPSNAAVCVTGEVHLSTTQRHHASEIIAVGQEMKVPDQGIVIALATALAESDLHNLANDGTGDLNKAQVAAHIERSLDFPHDGVGHDHGSVGTFQQQVTMWGSIEELMNPRHSAKLFYETLLALPDWQQKPLGPVAQQVQLSAIADGSQYAAEEGVARRLLGGPGECRQQAIGTPTIDRMINALRKQGNVNDSVKATLAAYAAVGISLPDSIAEQLQWLKAGNGHPVQPGLEQKGDLLIKGDQEGLVISPGKALLMQGKTMIETSFDPAAASIWRVWDPTVGAGANLIGWRVPLPKGSYTISSPFGQRENPTGKGITNHRGIDLAAPLGTPISAVQAGTITYSGPAHGYGWLIEIDHGKGIKTLYGHMEMPSVLVNKGQWVHPGKAIASVGDGGNSTGPHLHLQIMQNGQAVDPQAFFSRRGRPL